MGDKKFYTIAELAEMFGVSRLTIHRRIKGGDIKAIKFGNLVRIPAASLKKYLVEA